MVSALADDTWVRDLAHNNASGLLHEFIELWRIIQAAPINLQEEVEDAIKWNLQSSGNSSGLHGHLEGWKDKHLHLASTPKSSLVQRSSATPWLAKQLLMPALPAKPGGRAPPVLVLPRLQAGLVHGGALEGMLLAGTGFMADDKLLHGHRYVNRQQGCTRA